MIFKKKFLSNLKSWHCNSELWECLPEPELSKWKVLANHWQNKERIESPLNPPRGIFFVAWTRWFSPICYALAFAHWSLFAVVHHSKSALRCKGQDERATRRPCIWVLPCYLRCTQTPMNSVQKPEHSRKERWISVYAPKNKNAPPTEAVPEVIWGL